MAGLGLSRKVGQKILIDDNIVITVIHSSSGKVRLNIDAPLHVRVIREELQGVKIGEKNGLGAASGSVSVPNAAGV
jgi:carbon storage regulator